MDRQAMEIISRCDADGFAEYLQTTRNTICGRHPIAVLLRAVEHLIQSGKRDRSSGIIFTHYAQSNQVNDKSDSSVSYASAYLALDKC